jgi:glycosyltransferase involved in cell wall biosynthesis
MPQGSGQPLVSVLLPARDAEATLAAALRSVARQSEERFECVVVDDGSWDRTRDLATEQAQRDGRFRVLAQPGKGLVAALQAGIEACRGEYVARMDADDVMHRHRLAAQCAALSAHPELDAVGCHVRTFPRRGLQEGRRTYESWLNSIDSPRRVREEAFVECPLAHPTLCIRRSVLVAYGYRDRGWPEDYDLVLRLLGDGRQLSSLPRRLLLWRDHADRLSRTHATYSIAAFTACKADFLARGFLAKRDDYVLWGYGETGKALRRALAFYDKDPAHIVELHPGRIGEIIHGAAVIRPEELPAVPRRPVVVSVAGVRPRTEIRTSLEGMGFQELSDFICAA